MRRPTSTWIAVLTVLTFSTIPVDGGPRLSALLRARAALDRLPGGRLGPPLPATMDSGQTFSSKTLSFTAPAIGRQRLSFEVEVSDGVETALAATQIELTDRTYEAGLNGSGAAGGCNQTRHGEPAGAGSFAGIWLMTVVLIARRRKVIAPD